ncbi:MAG: metallophosphoesterase family protein [Limisphaerales bacterium]
MPGILHNPVDRRSFLKTAALAGTALAAAGCRSTSDLATGGRRELHLALLSDTHTPGDRLNGHRGLNPWTNLQSLVPQVVEARPEGVVINGDAARLEGLPADYRELRSLLQPVAEVAPVYIGLGNHDDRARFFEVFPPPAGVSRELPGKHVLVIEHEVVRVVVLDSLLYVNKVAGLLGRDQCRWLAEYLPQHADRPVVLFVHHTLGDGDGDLLDAGRLFEIIRPHRQVKAIFYGHSHVWSLDARERVQLINLPAVGYNFRDQDPVGWVEARFHRQGVELTLRALAGNRTDDGKMTAVKWA